MADLPGRSGYEPDNRAEADDSVDEGWGSPLPAEYGSLRSVRRAPLVEPATEPGAGRATEAVSEPRRVTSLRRRSQGEDPAAAPVTGNGTARGRTPARRSARRRPPADPGPAPVSARPLNPAESLAADPTPTIVGIPPVAAVAAPVDVTTALVPPAEALPLADAQPLVDAQPYAAPVPMLEDVRVARPRRRPGRVHTRANIRHIDVSTVVKVSVVFYLVVLLSLVSASVLLWVFADTFGALPSLEKSIRTLFSLKTFVLHPETVAYYTALAGAVLCVAGTFINVLSALVYNLIADVVGGVRVELESMSRE